MTLVPSCRGSRRRSAQAQAAAQRLHSKPLPSAEFTDLLEHGRGRLVMPAEDRNRGGTRSENGSNG
jgi:hypothetical protein